VRPRGCIHHQVRAPPTCKEHRSVPSPMQMSRRRTARSSEHRQSTMDTVFHRLVFRRVSLGGKQASRRAQVSRPATRQQTDKWSARLAHWPSRLLLAARRERGAARPALRMAERRASSRDRPRIVCASWQRQPSAGSGKGCAQSELAVWSQSCEGATFAGESEWGD